MFIFHRSNINWPLNILLTYRTSNYVPLTGNNREFAARGMKNDRKSFNRPRTWIIHAVAIIHWKLGKNIDDSTMEVQKTIDDSKKDSPIISIHDLIIRVYLRRVTLNKKIEIINHSIKNLKIH